MTRAVPSPVKALALPLALAGLLVTAAPALPQGELVSGVVPQQLGVAADGDVSGSTVPVDVTREWRGNTQVITVTPR